MQMYTLLHNSDVFCFQGILTYEGRKALSSLSYLVFIPALNFTSIGGRCVGVGRSMWMRLMGFGGMVHLASMLFLGFGQFSDTRLYNDQE